MKDGQSDGAGEAIRIEGIAAGTRIATRKGWRYAETLRTGDAVLTLEHGYQPLSGLQSYRFPARTAPPVTWPLIVPRDALDCREPILLLPDQLVLIESDQADTLFGDALALIPALALEGLRGIRRVRPRARAETVTLTFASPQIVFASRAVLLACHGESVGRMPRKALLPRRPALDGCPLSRDQTFHLVACMMAEDLGSALRPLGD